MAKLREILSKTALQNVRTYIQSGNVIAESSLSQTEVETLIHDEIKINLGGEIPCVARTPEVVRKILKENPFQSDDTKLLYFTLFKTKPSEEKLEILNKLDFSPDLFQIIGQTCYLYLPNNYGRTKINNNYLEKKLSVVATSRNFNTMTKMVELAKSE